MLVRVDDVTMTSQSRDVIRSGLGVTWVLVRVDDVIVTSQGDGGGGPGC